MRTLAPQSVTSFSETLPQQQGQQEQLAFPSQASKFWDIPSPSMTRTGTAFASALSSAGLSRSPTDVDDDVVGGLLSLPAFMELGNIVHACSSDLDGRSGLGFRM